MTTEGSTDFTDDCLFDRHKYLYILYRSLPRQQHSKSIEKSARDASVWIIGLLIYLHNCIFEDSSNISTRWFREELNFEHDPDTHYAYPFYWAPFLLMGNWL